MNITSCIALNICYLENYHSIIVTFSDNLVNCSMFARSNCLGLAIAALSSEVEDVRGIACCVLQLYSVHLNGTRIIKERNEIKTVLNLLKIALTEKNGKLSPFYANYFFDALRIIMRPGNYSEIVE